jgi:hypothetical protein
LFYFSSVSSVGWLEGERTILIQAENWLILLAPKRSRLGAIGTKKIQTDQANLKY